MKPRPPDPRKLDVAKAVAEALVLEGHWPLAGFERLQAFCDRTEVAPIHPFKLDLRVSETDTVYEGLYAFDPAALGPACATVTLALYSEKEPAKADTRVIDPKILRQIWQDFELDGRR